MASSAPPSDATDSPVLSLSDKSLRALRKGHKRILEMEEPIAQRKRIKKEQEDLLGSKPSVVASIEELEQLRPQLSSALQEELSLAAQRLPSDNGGEANNNAAAKDGTAGGASSTHTSAGVPEMATSSGPAKDEAANDGTAGGDSGAHASTESHEMTNSSGDDFEVFLSFRGPDTRAGITDFLYTSLTDAGIRTFRDDEALRKGEEFSPKLLQAIKQSKILVPIFSKNYASSVWCLKEVVQMVECKTTGGQKIMPIFYDVAPSDVRHPTGRYSSYREAFCSHEEKKRHEKKTIEKWKAALSAVGEINGWDLHNEGENRREGEFVKKFTREIFNELKKASLVVSDYLVDVPNHVDAIMGMIDAQTNETRIVGIHGMGGIGKTTTAKIIYNRLSENFEGCCFLANIREMSEKSKGIECLQNQLISGILRDKCIDVRNIDDGIKIIKDRLSNKRVLLLLDDLYEKKHMDELVGERGCFGKGSILIITTRNRETLVALGVDDYYELTAMDHGQSLKLFSKYAFKRDSPLDEYINQSNRAIDIAGGLPLALKVMGSLFYCTDKEMWDARLKMLENVPHDKIQSTLKISYDALTPRQKDIFLDIACFFIGYDKDILVHFWDEPDFFSEVAMQDLQNLSLIKFNEDNKVQMHDLLRDFGREMVRQQSNRKIVKQSRVWDPKIGSELLRKHKGKKEIEALCLNFDNEGQYRLTYKDFESLSNLRFLEVDDWTEYLPAEKRLIWHELPTNEKSDLLPHLRWLSWSNFPPTFNIANFFMEDVVILNLSKSNITNDWKGWSHMKVMKNLKVMNLNACRWLERLPDSIENLESLVELDISQTGIKELPDSIGKLKNLKRLNMWGSVIIKIPAALWTIEKLEKVQASTNRRGHFHVNIGNCIYKNQSLRILKLHGAKIYSLPRLPESLVTLYLHSLYMDTFPDLSNLTNLKELNLELCSRDSHVESDGVHWKFYGASFGLILPRDSDGFVENLIPRWMGNLSKLESLHLTSPYEHTSPTDITLPPHLKSLYLDCPNLRHLLRLPSSLSSLHLSKCYSLCSMESLDLSSPHLKWLSLEGCCDLRHLPRLPSSLSSLGLSGCESLCSMESLDLSSPHLKWLSLEGCHDLRHFPRLPSSLSSLNLSGCESLCSMEDLSNLKNLSSLKISCSPIEEIQGLGCLENLRDLHLESLGQLKLLPDLSNLSKLTNLHVLNCGDLVEIQGALPQFLDKLRIYGCDSLQNLPDLSSLKVKQKVEISCCNKLNVEAILGFARINPRDLQLRGFAQLQNLPDLSNSSEVRCLRVQSCANLVEIQGELPESLQVLEIYFCRKIQKLPGLSSLKELQRVDLEYCNELKGEAILSSARRSQANLWENLQYLRIYGLEQMEILPDLSNLNKLRHLKVGSCANLVEIQGELPESLEVLNISSCRKIQKLPDLSRLNGLQTVKICDCFGLNVEAISSLCLEKSVEFVKKDVQVGWDA